MTRLDTIQKRLDQLESENRSLRRKLKHNSLLIMAICSCFLLIAATQSGRFNTMTVQELVLEDASGNQRIKLGVDEKGNVLQQFFDPNQTERLRLGLLAEGIARVRLFNSEGLPRISSSVFGSNSETPDFAGMTLYDKSGQKARISLDIYQDEDNGAAISLYTPESKQSLIMRAEKNYCYQSFGSTQKKQLLILGTSNKDASYLAFYGQDGKSRYYTGLNEDRSFFERVYDFNGQQRLISGVDEDGDAYTSYQDPKGAIRFEIATLNDNQAHLMSLDHAGKSRWRAGTTGDQYAYDYHWDTFGKLRMASFIEKAGNAYRQLYDSDGKTRLAFSVDVNRNAVFGMYNRQGTVQTHFVSEWNDTFSRYIEKSAGEQLWEGIGHLLQAKEIYDTISQ